MAFLDNSGDIILDAVLTDTGRARLSRGDGSFRITQFAVGDDEINYALYRNANHGEGAHASGSAYYDLEILQTPILEAFTDNTAMLKSKLLSISSTNLLYMPILKINHLLFPVNSTTNTFIVLVDTETEAVFATDASIGVLYGETLTGNAARRVQVDQGLDIAYKIIPDGGLDSLLVENTYLVQMDNRLGGLMTKGGTAISYNFIDDDQVAHYLVTLKVSPTVVYDTNRLTTTTTSGQVIEGPRGTNLEFKIQARNQMRDSTYLYERLGTSTTSLTDTFGSSTTTSTAAGKYIDSTVRIIGMNSGYSLDIPVRYVRKDT